MEIQKINLLPGDVLTAKQVKDYIANHDTTEFTTHLKYWKGANEEINDRSSDTNYTDQEYTINNMIAVPHARKIAKTVVGYAFKPGLVTYTCEDEKYLAELKKIFDANNEQEKTADSGLYMSSRGISYELHYIEKGEDGLNYRFAFVEPEEIIPFHNYDIEPKLICAIRYYIRKEGTDSVIYADVYYTDKIQYFKIKGNEIESRGKDEFHYFKAVPIRLFKNNKEYQPDYWAVKELIDAYDVLMSDSMNEFQKFADAYLRLVGFTLGEDEKKKAKQLRVFEDLDSPDAVTYLTKDINTEFIDFMTKLIEDLIFKYAHVYDPTDENFSGVQSGISLKYKLFDMETNLISFKESYHKQGLIDRLNMIKKFLEIRGITTDKPVEIHYKRNEPNNLIELADVVSKLKGILDDETLLTFFPADIVPDVKKVLDKLKADEEEQRKINLDKLNGNEYLGEEEGEE